MTVREHEFLESLFWLLRATVRHLKGVTLFVGIAVVASIVITAFVDQKFEATAVVLPPISEAAGMQRVAAEMGNIAKLFGGGFSDSRDADVLEMLLLSSDLHRDVIDRFQLATLYKLDKNPKKPPKTADVLKAFRKMFEVEPNEANFFELTLRDKSPERAVEILNYILFKADSLFSNYQAEEANNSTQFYHHKVEQARQRVDSLQKTMIEFQQKSGVIDPEVQFEETIKLLAELRKDQEQAASELAMERQERGEESLRYSQLKSRHSAAVQATNRLKKRRDDILLPVKEAPALIQTFVGLKLDLELQLKVLEGLQLQVELAQLREKTGAAQFIILERPWINDKKVSPPRGAIVVVTAMLSTLLAVFASAFLELVAEQRASNGRLYELLQTTAEALRRNKK